MVYYKNSEVAIGIQLTQNQLELNLTQLREFMTTYTGKTKTQQDMKKSLEGKVARSEKDLALLHARATKISEDAKTKAALSEAKAVEKARLKAENPPKKRGRKPKATITPPEPVIEAPVDLKKSPEQ